MNRNISEIFDEVKKENTREGKINILRKYRNPILESVLRFATNPNIKFRYKTKESLPPYKPNIVPAGLGYTNIGNHLRTCYLFEENNPKRPANLSQEKMDMIMMGILEILEDREAEVFANMITKDLHLEMVDWDFVRETFGW